MMKLKCIAPLALLPSLLSNAAIANQTSCQVVTSPAGNLALSFDLLQGRPTYQINHNGKQLLAPSTLGFEFKHNNSLKQGFEITSCEQQSVDAPWQRVWGPTKQVANRYNQLVVQLTEMAKPKRQMQLTFRLYDTGVGFRYSIPKQANMNQFVISKELTEFNLTGDHTTWWTPADYDSYESLYQKTPLSKVNAANTPVTFKTADDAYLSIHEAALTDYAGMTLRHEGDKAFQLHSELVPWPNGDKVRTQTPFNSPWRTIQVAASAPELLASNLIVNLNEPSVIEDTSWIKPMKYMGIWWGMHMRKYTWEAGPKHGATTANTKEYMDFASQNGIGGVLVEGWNKGWETWHTDVSVQDFTQAYDDFDLAEIANYGKRVGAQLIGHHETGGNIPVYEEQMQQAFELYEKVGVHAIKTGYAGKMLPEGTYHHGQQMVNHYREVVRLAAKHKIMINAHEPIKPTGIRRTYPNMMTREGGRGMEWNGWSEGNPPEHTVTLPFTRLLAGPMDYTPGIFDIKFDPQQQYRVHSTLARQLAMYVVLFSPMQMAADMVENYRGQKAFEFIRQVPVDWEDSKYLNGEIGDFITVARRSGKQWFVGAMTDESPRMLTVKLDFLEPGTRYQATIYSDAMATDFDTNPTAIAINKLTVTKGDVLNVSMTSAGGQAIHIQPLQSPPVKTLTSLTGYNQVAERKFGKFEHDSRYGELKTVEHLALNKPVNVLSPYDAGYTGGGDSALVDGFIGGSDYKSLWQGYRMKDLDVVVDLGAETDVSHISVGFMQSVLHSILLPTEVRFSVSDDNVNFRQLHFDAYHTKQDVPDYQRKRFSADFKPQSARYVRVRAKNLTYLPKWHIRPGQETFIFADEIIVK